MASFAKLGLNNKVIEVNSVVNEVLHDSNGVEQENIGIDFLNNLYQTNDTWIQTSYNTKGGQHTLGGTPFRKNFAGIGYTYDEDRDAFIAPKLYASWILVNGKHQLLIQMMVKNIIGMKQRFLGI